MNSILEINQYPGFEYQASEVYKFHQAGDLFSCMLKDRQVIHFTPLDQEQFKLWLLINGIELI